MQERAREAVIVARVRRRLEAEEGVPLLEGRVAVGRKADGTMRQHTFDLVAELVVLRLRMDEPAEVAVEVAERACDTFGGDLEGVEDGRAGALDLVQAAAGRLAEVDRHQDDRERDEHSRYDSPLEGVACAGGVRSGPGAR